MTDKTAEELADAMATGYCMVFSDTQQGTELDCARHKAYVHGFLQGRADALRWITDGETSTPIETPILGITAKGNQHTGEVSVDGEFIIDGGASISIVAWMPLPREPKA